MNRRPTVVSDEGPFVSGVDDTPHATSLEHHVDGSHVSGRRRGSHLVNRRPGVTDRERQREHDLAGATEYVPGANARRGSTFSGRPSPARQLYAGMSRPEGYVRLRWFIYAIRPEEQVRSGRAVHDAPR